MSVKVNLKGFQLDLKNATDEVLQQVDEVLTDGANRIEERAKTLAPVDRGLLRNQIFADTDIPFEKRVTIAGDVFYAAYQEFGTGGKFKDQGFPDVAKTYKGKAGRSGDLVENIYQWLRRKKYFPPEAKTDKQKRGYAKFIAFRILKYGIEPANDGTGYFFRAYREILPTIEQEINQIK